MPLTLYYHPLSSFCWKALIALYEADVAFEPRQVNLGDPEDRAAFEAVRRSTDCPFARKARVWYGPAWDFRCDFIQNVDRIALDLSIELAPGCPDQGSLPVG